MFIFIQFFLITCASSSIEEYDFCNSFNDDRFQFYLSNYRPIVKIKINDFVLDFLIDTGSNYNVLTNRGVQKILPFIPEDKKLEKNDTLKMSGDKLGSIKFSVEFNDKNICTYGSVISCVDNKDGTSTCHFLNRLEVPCSTELVKDKLK